MLRYVLFLIFSVVTLSFCSAGYLGDSKIPANERNSVVYNILMQYKKGVETRNIDLIIPLVSKKYYENGSTTQRESDDYGYKELVNEKLPLLLNSVKAIQYNIKLLGIKFIGNRAQVTYEYSAYFLYSEGDKEAWHHKNDFNQIELSKEKGHWKIVSGL